MIASGNTCVVITSQDRPLPAITLSEVLATSDVPGGVINIITGRTAEIAPWLASHGDVNALDLTGAPESLRADLERSAAGTVKRVLRNKAGEDFGRDAGHVPPARLPGDEDRLAPDGRLIRTTKGAFVHLRWTKAPFVARSACCVGLALGSQLATLPIVRGNSVGSDVPAIPPDLAAEGDGGQVGSSYEPVDHGSVVLADAI